MNGSDFNKIHTETTIKAPVSMVWELWTHPEHIQNWNTASPDWHTVKAENDLTKGGRFNYRMEAKDGSFGFDFSGTYDAIQPLQTINYTLDDNRKVTVSFISLGDSTKVIQIFEAETQNSLELQQTGWQAILDNFNSYVISTLK